MMKKNYKFFIALGIIILLVLLLGIGLFLFTPYLHFKDDSRVLERGSVHLAGDFILETNGDVIPENTMLYTDEVGNYTFHYSLRKYFMKKDVEFNYEVVDTTAPKIEIKNRVIIKDPGKVFSEDDILNNVKIDEGNLEIDTDYDPDISGTYLVNIKATDAYNNGSSDFFEIIVNDIQAPIVFVEGHNAEVLKGSEFDIDDIISYGDNVDAKPELTITGEVDTSKLGSYPLHGKLADSANNVTEWDFVVEVVDEYSDYDYEEDVYDFNDFINDYQKPGRKLGMDISEWQYDVDFEKIKEAGCEFVIMRLGFSHDGKLTLDKKFKQNLENAKKVNMPIGVYIYFHDDTKEELLSTLNTAFEVLNGTSLQLPFFFDWEEFHDFQEHEISFKDLNQLYKVFKSEVEKAGYEAMLYGSKFYLNEVWANTDEMEVWLAHYIDWSNYDKPYRFWQLSATGRIDGIEGNTDLDIMFTNP